LRDREDRERGRGRGRGEGILYESCNFLDATQMTLQIPHHAAACKTDVLAKPLLAGGISIKLRRAIVCSVKESKRNCSVKESV
jgi:hypothetical protein